MTRTLLMISTVCVVGVLTMGGTAVRSVNRLWLRTWIDRDEGEDERVPRFVERPMRLLLGAGTAIALVVFLSGALLVSLNIGTPLMLLRDAVVLSLLILALGQLLPRAIARRWAPQLIPVLVPMLRVVTVAVGPVRFMARRLASMVAHRVAPRTTARHAAVATPRESIADLLRDGTLEGIGAAEEIAIISSVVQLGERTVADVMTPRADVFALDESLPPDVLAERIAHAAFSRVPVYRGTLDQIVGMVHAFDLFIEPGAARPPLRPVSEASANSPATDLLYHMLRARRQLAVIRDAQQTVVGIVTLEDLLEELVGDIRDEHDEPAPRIAGEQG